MESTQTDAPIAIRTRSKVHQQDTACKGMTINEGPFESQFAMETKELFLKLIKQADERYCEKNSKMQMIWNSKLRLYLSCGWNSQHSEFRWDP
jgi:hypothetical protein